MTRTCIDCDKGISGNGKTGRCRGCALRHSNANPEIRAKAKASMAALTATTEYRQQLGKSISRSRNRRLIDDPEFAAKMRESGRKLFATGLGHKAMASGTDARKRAAKTSSDRLLSWCPAAYRKRYMALRRKGMPCTEARPIILAQAEREQYDPLLRYTDSAIDHLRRFSPVIRKGDRYLVGIVTLERWQIIQRAILRGWQAPERMAA